MKPGGSVGAAWPCQSSSQAAPGYLGRAVDDDDRLQVAPSNQFYAFWFVVIISLTAVGVWLLVSGRAQDTDNLIGRTGGVIIAPLGALATLDLIIGWSRPALIVASGKLFGRTLRERRFRFSDADVRSISVLRRHGITWVVISPQAIQDPIRVPVKTTDASALEADIVWRLRSTT